MESVRSTEEKSISGWKKYSFTPFHTSSFLYTTIPTYAPSHGVEQSIQGNEEYSKEAERETCLESVRLMAEECDSLKRAMVVTEAFGYWGGFASGLVVDVVDYFDIDLMDIVGIFDPMDPDTHTSTPDRAMHLSSLSDQSTRFLPLYLNENMKVSKILHYILSLFLVQHRVNNDSCRHARNILY